MSEPCPDTDQLRRMLADDLSPTEAGPVEGHLAGCPNCQRVLVALTGDSSIHVAPDDETLAPGVSAFVKKALAWRPTSVHRLSLSPGETVPNGTAAALLPRPSIDGYEILDELGHGGMGVVFRARDIRLNRTVAVKMLLPGGHASPELVARFKAEAETVARLQHPNVVQIHSVGEHQGQPYFVMEFVGGGSLAARLDGTPWHPRDGARLVEVIAHGVEAVHELGVIHRDLKPGNVLMAGDGTPKLGDFGLAKDLEGDSELTRTGSLVGSPSYMSPEQAEGNASGIGPGSDVYSLGAIYYELLTGRPPFRGASVLETLEQVRTAEPVPPSRLVPGLSRDAETIALKCLEKAPSRRYGSAGELADDLRRFVDRMPIHARRIGPLGRLVRWSIRNRGMAGLAATVLLSLLAVAVVSLVAAVRVTAAAEQERRTLYFARMNLTQQAWEAADVPRMQELLEPYRHDARRGFEWFYWWRLAHRPAAELLGHQRRIAALGFSSDGRTLVSAGDEPSVIIWDPSRFEARTVIPMTCRAESLAFAPDNSTIAVGGNDGTIRLWKTSEGESPRQLGSGTGPVMAVAFRDARTLTSVHLPNVSRTWDLPSGRLLHERRGADLPAAPVADDHVPACAISLDGRIVALAALDGTVFVWPAEPGDPARSGPTPPAAGAGRHPIGGRPDDEDVFGAGTIVRSLAFSHDGRLLAFAGEDRLVTVRDQHRRGTLHTFRGHSATVFSMAFSPDDRLLAAASLDNTVSIWNVASGRLSMTLKGHGGPAKAVAFSPDGKSVASGAEDAMVLLWRVAGRDSDAPLTGHTDGVRAIALSPDGSTVATSGRDGRILFWSTATGERLASIEPDSPLNAEGLQGGVEALVYSNDGRWLISASRHAVLRLWDARTHAFVADLRDDSANHARIDSLAVPREGPFLASGRVGGHVTLWDLVHRVPLTTYNAGEQQILSLAFSPDGQTLASTSQTGKIHLRDVAGSRDDRTLALDGSTIYSLAFSPDGRTLASGTSEGTLIFWDAPSWQPRGPQRAHTNTITSLVFTPDGRTLVTGGRDDMIRLWEAATAELESTLKGHSGNVMGLVMSRDGQCFVSGSLDRTARIWRAASEDDIRRQEGGPSVR
jgi:WD40 repeat protein